jgi:SAM-dependent methyltransferase
MRFLRKNDYSLLGDTFKKASEFQQDFLKDNKLSDYSWSSNPLHQWSRYFEYPFIINAIDSINKKNLSILDYGAGKTFLPFFLLQKKHDVICYDVVDYSDYYENTPIGFTKSLKTIDKKIDVAYSVSVLEHTEDPVAEISNIYNLLADDGIFIMTFDVDCRGDLSISLDNLQKVTIFLNDHFDEISYFKDHSSPLLTFENSKYGLYGSGVKFIAKRLLIACKGFFSVSKSKISPYDIRVGTFIGKKKSL